MSENKSRKEFKDKIWDKVKNEVCKENIKLYL